MSKKLGLITSSLLAGICAMAQKDSISSRDLQEVIVTANKFPQKQNTTGKVISVITKEQIARNSGKTLGQLLNEQAGITINGALNNLGMSQSLFMRGAASGRTLLLVDGVPVYDPTLINNEFDLNLIALNQVECIEICRGAQSTLYGSDAVAGVINIITAKQKTSKPFHLNAGFSGGNYNTFKGNLQVSGQEGKLSYAAKYSKIRTDGFSSAFDSSGKQDFDKDGYHGDVVNTSLKYQVNPALSIRTFAQYSRNKTELDAGAFTDERDYSFTNKAVLAGSGVAYQKNKVSLALNYQYGDNRRDYLNDSLHAEGFAKYSTDHYYGKTQFVEAFSNIDLGGGFSFLQGADYRFSSMNSQYYSLSSYGPYQSAFKDTSHSQASVYGSLFYSGLKERLHADLGGRINVHSRYGSNSTFSFNPSFAITQHYRVFGSYATAFKAPTLYQLYSAYGNQELKPEQARTYELGAQQQHLHFSNRVVFFQRKITNGLDFNYLSYKYYNINQQTVKGIEWENTIQAVRNLTIGINYTYLQPKEHSQSRTTYQDTVYKYMLRRPQHQVNINVGYQFTDALFASVSAKYASKRYDVGGYQKEDVALDDYLVVNAHAAYKFKKFVQLFVDAQNVTNRKFFDVWGYNSIPLLVSGGFTFSL
ncbi:TonB-dependent receptor [Chitinophagaceae bacterium LB-8]|uniref:TonB-dependent receptor n=1 Tax=Paraflavisolibacter caeni TaxID=2982496 RepID=A0A9X3B969_9BACT|nr:TonB-dependent receptor [Paraflavisolibacter caeni]MCU7551735.1 TonB-dependent receptor [Paraflavisolibacter caeni]